MSSSPRISLKVFIIICMCVARISGSAISKTGTTPKTTTTPATPTKTPAPSKPVDQQLPQESRIRQSIHMQAPPPIAGKYKFGASSSSANSGQQATSGSSPQAAYKTYPLHSDVHSAASQHTKTEVHHSYHNEVVAGLVEVFGFAIIPILVLPLVGLGICYILWSARSKQNHHPYAFDNGSTYGTGTHSSVVGYDYSHLNKRKGLERKNSELTARILPHL